MLLRCYGSLNDFKGSKLRKVLKIKLYCLSLGCISNVFDIHMYFSHFYYYPPPQKKIYHLSTIHVNHCKMLI